MQPNLESLLFLVKKYGTENALKMVDIESINDPLDPHNTVKIICRTINYSIQELERVLIDKIVTQHEQADNTK